MENTLYYGDNLPILKQYIPDNFIDLIYLDPPFNSNKAYNILFKEPTGEESEAQITAFEDTWHWGKEAAKTFDEIIQTAPTNVIEMMTAFKDFIGHNDVMAYLTMMCIRLMELRRVLKKTGSIYLHCDPTASHYLKVLMDTIFDKLNFKNEIIWRRTGAHGPRRSFGPIHDTILFYTKTNDYFFQIVKRPYMKGHVQSRYAKDKTGRYKFISGGNVLTGPGATSGESGSKWRGFNPSAKNRHWAIPGFLTEKMPPEFSELGVLEKLETLYQAGLIEINPGAAWPTPLRYLDEDDGQPLQDIWAHQPYTEGTVYETKEGIDEDVAWLGPTDPERLGYQTQKPLGLLERIINSSCPTDGIVLDPFCGCGTTIAVAQKLNREWIGIDITYLAIAVIKQRMLNMFPKAQFKVIGEPVDLAGARALASQNKYQFQWWALPLIDARPYGDPKKGGDKGIDGILYFQDEKNKVKKGIVSVKSGRVVPEFIRDLRSVVDREKAIIGILITLEEPTKGMKTEASTSGFYKSPLGKKHPKIQIITIEELLNGTRIDTPPVITSYKRAKITDLIQAQSKIKYQYTNNQENI